jgi:hypothetical protein
MGNESSLLSGCQIDETPILKFGSDYSLHNSQKLQDKSQMTVFISKDQVSVLLNFFCIDALAKQARVTTQWHSVF